MQFFGKGVDARDADAVQTAGDLIGVFVEFTARMEDRHDDFERCHFASLLLRFFLMLADGNAAAVVFDR